MEPKHLSSHTPPGHTHHTGTRRMNGCCFETYTHRSWRGFQKTIFFFKYYIPKDFFSPQKLLIVPPGLSRVEQISNCQSKNRSAPTFSALVITIHTHLCIVTYNQLMNSWQELLCFHTDETDSIQDRGDWPSRFHFSLFSAMIKA